MVSTLRSTEITYEAEKMIQKSATVLTDRRRCYSGLKDICAAHEAIVVKDKKEISKAFPWIYIAILKKKILGMRHQVKDSYMQNYLSEFCYKFNRRYSGEKLFDRLVIAAIEKHDTCPNPNKG